MVVIFFRLTDARTDELQNVDELQESDSKVSLKQSRKAGFWRWSRKNWALSTGIAVCHKKLFAALTVLATMGIVSLVLPIRLSPAQFFVQNYNWQPISTVQLWKILRVKAPHMGAFDWICSRITNPLPKSALDLSQVKFYEDIPAKARNPSLTPKLHEKALLFLPIMDRATKVTLLYTYRVFADALDSIGVQHVVSDGTLLGMERVSGILPWDDDIDVHVNLSKWVEIRKALSCIEGFELAVKPNMGWSFFPSNGNVSQTMPHKKYPFVDMFFITEDNTYLWDMKYKLTYRKEDMYPLRRATLDGLSVPVPNHPKKIILSQHQDLDMCHTQTNRHNKGPKVHEIISIPCSMLFPLYGEFWTGGKGKEERGKRITTLK